MNNVTRAFWYFLCRYILIIFSDKTFAQILFWVQTKRFGRTWYKMDFNNPKTFNEKLNFIKFNYWNDLGPKVADKVKVRDYVENVIGKEYLIPIIGVYKSVEEIPVNDLPNKFALKTNHGSGWNIICKDKSQLDWERSSSKMRKWLNRNAYYLSREWQYKNIEPQIICEELLEYEVKDYKFFCRKGEPLLIQVDKSRFTNHQRSFFDVNWNGEKLFLTYPNIIENVSKPLNLQKMIQLAEKLSEPFLFCRVDLYEHLGRIYFGEITLFPGGASEPFGSYAEDLEMGKMIDIY